MYLYIIKYKSFKIKVIVCAALLLYQASFHKIFKRCKISITTASFYLLITQALEHINKHFSNDLHDLMIVKFEGHFHVKADKLRQVPMCVGIFCSEHWKQIILKAIDHSN